MKKRSAKNWTKRKRRTIASPRRPGDAHVGAARAGRRLALERTRSIVADLRRNGPEVWQRFHAGAVDQLWYYRSLSVVLSARLPGALTDELRGDGRARWSASPAGGSTWATRNAPDAPPGSAIARRRRPGTDGGARPVVHPTADVVAVPHAQRGAPGGRLMRCTPRVHRHRAGSDRAVRWRRQAARLRRRRQRGPLLVGRPDRGCRRPNAPAASHPGRPGTAAARR